MVRSQVVPSGSAESGQDLDGSGPRGGLRSAEVARRAGVNVETLRYYERRGLLADPPRTQSGYRLYPADAPQRVRQIKLLQQIGFSLADVEGLLTLRPDSQISCEDLSRIADERLVEVEQKLSALLQVRDALIEVTAACCPAPHGDGACRRLSALRRS